MDHRDVKSAPDFTNAALAMGLVNLLWVFMVIWAHVGFWAVLLLGFVLDKLILRLARRG